MWVGSQVHQLSHTHTHTHFQTYTRTQDDFNKIPNWPLIKVDIIAKLVATNQLIWYWFTPGITSNAKPKGKVLQPWLHDVTWSARSWSEGGGGGQGVEEGTWNIGGLERQRQVPALSGCGMLIVVKLVDQSGCLTTSSLFSSLFLSLSLSLPFFLSLSFSIMLKVCQS